MVESLLVTKLSHYDFIAQYLDNEKMCKYIYNLTHLYLGISSRQSGTSG
jgi:hypothetical protein